jgi:cell division protein FtsB
VSGKTTSTLERPETPPGAADRGRSRLGDLSRPIQIDRRISRTRRTNVLLAIAAVAIAGALAAAIFVLPVKTLFNQDDQIAERTDQLTQLQTVNEDLRSEVARLRTDDGVREAAREQLGFVDEGEVRQSILDFPPVPTDLPDGWPYSLFEGFVAVRAAVASGAVTPATSAPSIPASVPPTAPATAPVTVAAAPSPTTAAP